MAIIWQSSWFWVILSAVLLLMLGSIIIKLNSPYIQTDSRQTMTATVPFDINPLQLHLDSQIPILYDDITITRPDCYDLANGGYSCLGQIQNNGTSLLGDTAINIQLYDSFGSELAEDTVAIEQRLIPSQSSAPYRVMFNSIDNQVLGDDYSINTSINSVFPPPKGLEILTTSQYNIFIANERYNITVSIDNHTAFLAENIRLFTTLSNTEWGIVGYNVYEVAQPIESGLSQIVDVEVIPFILTSEVEATFHAEGVIPR